MALDGLVCTTRGRWKLVCGDGGLWTRFTVVPRGSGGVGDGVVG